MIKLVVRDHMYSFFILLNPSSEFSKTFKLAERPSMASRRFASRSLKVCWSFFKLYNIGYRAAYGCINCSKGLSGSGKERL